MKRIEVPRSLGWSQTTTDPRIVQADNSRKHKNVKFRKNLPTERDLSSYECGCLINHKIMPSRKKK